MRLTLDFHIQLIQSSRDFDDVVTNIIGVIYINKECTVIEL